MSKNQSTDQILVPVILLSSLEKATYYELVFSSMALQAMENLLDVNFPVVLDDEK